MYYRLLPLLALMLLLFSCKEKGAREVLLAEHSDLAIGEATAKTSLQKKHKADTFKVNLEGNALVYG